MYLSQLSLNESRAYPDLANCYKLHQRIMQGFPDDLGAQSRSNGKILYYQGLDKYQILVQSNIAPDWSKLPQHYLVDFRIKEINYDDINLKVGNVYQFQLKAQPTKRDKHIDKIIDLKNNDDQVAWLERKASQHGFNILDAKIFPSSNIDGRKNTIKIIGSTVFYRGVLKITNTQQLIQALTDGIGKGRSWGCGLLTIAKVTYH